MKFADLVNEKIINLTYKGLRDDDLDVLTEVLQKSKTLEKLFLSKNQITLADGKFANALANNCTLQVLTLSRNKIGAEGAKRLAAALRNNQTLQEIRLWKNQIGDDGAKHLADALMDNKSLQMMGLQNNNIGDVGAQSLAASFVVNQSLREIWLERNQISDKGAKIMANAIECNRTIDTIYLDRNNISGPVQAKIQAIINDPNRMIPIDERSPLMQLMTFAKNKDEEIATKDEEIIKKDEALVSNEKQIATLELVLASKDEQIANLEADLKSPAKLIEKIMASKDAKISSLESDLKNSTPIVDRIDLSSKDAERASKRRRTSNIPKSNLAILHEQNQKMVHVKQEKNVAETALDGVHKEKAVVEAD